MGRNNQLSGVVGRKPIHLLDPKDREKVPQIHTQFIDIGAKNRKEAAKHVRLGDPVTFAVGLENLLGDRVVSRAFDDKVGSFVVAEVLRMVGEKKKRPSCTVYGVSTVQEELGLRGATTSAYQIQPDIGIAIEVGHASDYPEVDKKRVGEYKIGAGPILARGANINPQVYDLLIKAARKRKIPVQILGAPAGDGNRCQRDPAFPERRGHRPRQHSPALHAHAHRSAVPERSRLHLRVAGGFSL